jgi:hypothetical protein
VTDSPPLRLNLGMVGGGRGAFIGETHRIAALGDHGVVRKSRTLTDALFRGCAVESGTVRSTSVP